MPQYITGVLGNELDGQGYGRDEGSEPPQEAPRVLPAISTLEPTKPVTGDKIHYRLPIDEEKPVLYQTIPWEDHRRRFYTTNMLEKISDKMVRDKLYFFLTGFDFNTSFDQQI
jgi:hypothetical protein